MYGGHVTVPANSPHLRKSGSRTVVSDLGTSDLGNSSEENLLHLVESNEMKGVTTPLTNAAIMPSPILLWRLKFLPHFLVGEVQFESPEFAGSKYEDIHSFVSKCRVIFTQFSQQLPFWTRYKLGEGLLDFFFYLRLVLLFFIWGFSCCKIGWDSVMRMSADLRDLFLYEAFLYYNPLLLVTMMVWFWGINLWVFVQANVSYAKIFDLDQNHLTHREIWKCATWMTIIVPTSMTTYLYLYSRGEVSLAAFQPVLLYAAVTIVLIFPFDIFYLSSRFFLLSTLWQIVFPLQAITFPDFFVADILTSMSKVFSDLERSVCRMVHRQVATIAWFEADSVCGSHAVAIPIVLVLPYIFRLFQCLRQYKDTGEKTTLLNALKYSTAVPVIFLSALKYHVFPDKWTNMYRPLWLLSSFLNSLYSFYWDVTRDWDMSGFTRIFKFSKMHHMLYGRKWLLGGTAKGCELIAPSNSLLEGINCVLGGKVYFWVLGSNLILRCTWTYKLSAHLRHNYLTVFTITALEIFRRFQWVFFRVEHEWNKMNNSRQNIQLSMSDKSSEEDQLLNSSDHNV